MKAQELKNKKRITKATVKSFINSEFDNLYFKNYYRGQWKKLQSKDFTLEHPIFYEDDQIIGLVGWRYDEKIILGVPKNDKLFNNPIKINGKLYEAVEDLISLPSKINSLAEGYESLVHQIFGGMKPKTSKGYIVKTIVLSHQEFEYRKNNLLEPWKEIAGFGGTINPDMQDVTMEELWNNPDLMEKYRKNIYIELVKVIDELTGETFYVDPEGYDYARYVYVEKRI